MPPAYRYALYFAPPGAWRSAGNAWLGRCPETGAAIAPAPGSDPRQPDWMNDPRHYGLHATLKPPFRLKAGTSVQGLDAAVRALAARAQAFDAPVQCRELRGFLANPLFDRLDPLQAMKADLDGKLHDVNSVEAAGAGVHSSRMSLGSTHLIFSASPGAMCRANT